MPPPPERKRAGPVLPGKDEKDSEKDGNVDPTKRDRGIYRPGAEEEKKKKLKVPSWIKKSPPKPAPETDAMAGDTKSSQIQNPNIPASSPMASPHTPQLKTLRNAKPLPAGYGTGKPTDPTREDMIEVILNDRLGKKVRVKCNQNDTIADLKKLAAAQIGTRWDKIRIQKWYTIYKDNVTLADYEIHDGMGLELYYM